MENENIPEQDISEDVPEAGDPIGIEAPVETVPLETQDVSYDNVSEDFYEEVLAAQQTGNEILAQLCAIQFFLLAVLLAVLLYLIIKNNITKHF